MTSFLTPFKKSIPDFILIADDFYQKYPQFRDDFEYEQGRKNYLQNILPDTLNDYLCKLFEIDDPEPTKLALAMGKYDKMTDGAFEFIPHNASLQKIIIEKDNSVSKTIVRIKKLVLIYKEPFRRNIFAAYGHELQEENNDQVIFNMNKSYRFLRIIRSEGNKVEFLFERTKEQADELKKELNSFCEEINAAIKGT